MKLLTPVCEESRFVFPLSRPHMTDQSLKGLFEAFRVLGFRVVQNFGEQKPRYTRPVAQMLCPACCFLCFTGEQWPSVGFRADDLKAPQLPGSSRAHNDANDTSRL